VFFCICTWSDIYFLSASGCADGYNGDIGDVDLGRDDVADDGAGKKTQASTTLLRRGRAAEPICGYDEWHPCTVLRLRSAMGRGRTTFRKTEVARIVEGVKISGALGTFEFHLDAGLVRFHLTGESGAGPLETDESPNPWDKVLKDGKTKPALTLCKKVP
jgi:hypothetical protein